jgi:hypothetical protein
MERELLSHLSYELHISVDECVPLLPASLPPYELCETPLSLET